MTRLTKMPTVIAVESVTLKKETASPIGDLKLLTRVLRDYTSFSFAIIFSGKKIARLTTRTPHQFISSCCVFIHKRGLTHSVSQCLIHVSIDVTHTALETR